MEVRYSQEPETGMVLKNGLKDGGKEGKEPQGNLSKTLLKEPQDSFGPSGAVENHEKSRASSGDPDYCRRILVRGEETEITWSCQGHFTHRQANRAAFCFIEIFSFFKQELYLWA